MALPARESGNYSISRPPPGGFHRRQCVAGVDAGSARALPYRYDEFSLHEYVLLLRLYAQRGAVRIRHTLSHFPLVY
jgi:hypothetical protein